MNNEEITDTVPNQHKERKYMPTLDGLRGLACMIVVYSHVARIPSLGLVQRQDNYNIGSFGVVIFFALSGFLMSTLYLDKKLDLNNGIRFLVARFARITPTYYIAVTFALILSVTLLNGYIDDIDAIMAARLYMFIGSAEIFWSIPPEIQFYVFFLIIWASYGLLKSGNAVPFVLFTLLCIGFFVTKHMWPGILLPSKIHIFLLGVLAAYLARFSGFFKVVTSVPAQMTLVGLSIGYLFGVLDKEQIYNDLILPTLVAVGILSLSRSTIFSKVLETRPARLIGQASFSIYLFHSFLLYLLDKYALSMTYPAFLNLVIALTVAVGAPILFYIFCEKTLNEQARSAGLKICFGFKEKWLTRKQPIVPPTI